MQSVRLWRDVARARYASAHRYTGCHRVGIVAAIDQRHYRLGTELAGMRPLSCLALRDGTAKCEYSAVDASEAGLTNVLEVD